MHDPSRAYQEILEENALLKKRLHALEHLESERKQLAEKLRESQELFTGLVNTISDAVIHTDLKGNVVFVNHSTLQMSGYRWEDVEGRNMLQFVSPEDHDGLLENISKMMDGQIRSKKEYWLLTRDGRKLPFELSGDVLRNEDGTPFGFVVVCRDISDRKRAEEYHHYLGKIQGVLEMAGAVCHEMNQPLQVILGYCELLSKDFAEQGPIRDKIEAMKKQIERMRTITKKLLTLQEYKTQVYPGGGRIIDIDKTFR